MQKEYIKLQLQVENFIGIKMETRRHFDMLAATVFEHTKQMVSPTTLRRFWGYQDSESNASINTLNLLSRFVGYNSWEHFVANTNGKGEVPSDFINERNTLNVEALHTGDKVCLNWSPDRKVIIEFQGLDAFRVLESQNSKLQPNDTFHCKQFVEGMPLLCKSLLRVGYATMDYVCGKNGGIRFVTI